MALTLLASNNASSVLAAGISASATTLTVNTGTGTLFPSPVSGTSFFKLTLVDSATGTLTEIMHVTSRDGDVMTVDRGQEGTSARIWSTNDLAANMMTAGTLSYILGNFQPLDATLTALAGLATGEDKLPYFTGVDSVALTNLTPVARDILGKAVVSDILTYLGLGEAAELGVGSSSQMATGTSTTLLPTIAAVMSLFSKRTFSTNDYIRIPDVPGGLIIQWGLVSMPVANSTAVTFPVQFSSNCLSVVATNSSTTYPSAFCGVGGLTKNTFSIFSASASNTPSGNGTSYNWFAIGF